MLKANIGVINIGAPCGGINAAVRSFVRNGQYHGYRTFGIYDSIEGFAAGNVSEYLTLPQGLGELPHDETAAQIRNHAKSGKTFEVKARNSRKVMDGRRYYQE